VGTETDGSIVSPAAINGVVGIKPTLGVVSRAGIIPISHSQDTAGPMARSVADAAALLTALAGTDPGDAVDLAPPAGFSWDFTDAIQDDALRGARIGVARAFFGISDPVDAIAEAALDVLRRAGADVIDDVAVPEHDAYRDTEDEVLFREFRHDLGIHLGRLAASAPRSLADVIAFNERHRDTELRWFGQDLFVLAEGKGPLTDRAYLDALAANHRITRDEGIDAAIAHHRLDALAGPTSAVACLTDPLHGDFPIRGNSSLAAVAGYPHVTVPAGFVHGLPVGLSFVGPAFSEHRLIGLAHAFELATKARRAPAFLPTLALPADAMAGAVG
jgi:amidase